MDVPAGDFEEEATAVGSRSVGSFLGGGNSNIFIFAPNFGEDEPILTHIFQRG